MRKRYLISLPEDLNEYLWKQKRQFGVKRDLLVECALEYMRTKPEIERAVIRLAVVKSMPSGDLQV